MKRSPDKASIQESTPSGQSADSPQHTVYLGVVLALIFIVGLVLGFVGRPVVLEDPPIEVEVTAAPQAESQAAAEPDQAAMSVAAQTNADGTDLPITADDASDSSSSSTVMDLVLANARHIEGDADAPVTFIEFSDFK
jgi:hypothetical protein